MKKIMPRNVLIVLLVSITAFSVFKYAVTLKEKYELLNNINQLKIQLASLEKDKQALSAELKKERELEARLSKEISSLKDYLRASKKRLSRLFADYAASQKETEDLSARSSLLKSENRALIRDREKFIAISRENEELKAKLNSIEELKKAIRELKKRKTRVNVQLSRRDAPQVPALDGNGGYLFKDGKTTYPGIVRIEVMPVLEANNHAGDIRRNR